MATKVTDAPTSDGSDDELIAIVDPASPSGSRARKLTLGSLKATFDARYATVADLADKADKADLDGTADAVSLKATQDALDAAVARIGALEAAVDALQSSGTVTLGTLTLSAATFREDAAVGTVIGTISGKSVGSTLSLDPADGKVEISGLNLVVGSTAATPGTLSYDLIETLSGATGSPKTTAISIVVTAAPAAGGGVTSTAITNLPFLVPGTSLVTNERNSKSMVHDFEVGWMNPSNPNVAGDKTQAAASLTNVSTATLPAGLSRSGTNVWGSTGFTTYQNLYFPPGWQFIADAQSIVLDKCFFDQANCSPQSNTLTVKNTTFYNPSSRSVSIDNLINQGGALTLYRVAAMYAPGDFLKAANLVSMKQCFVYGAGDHGDIMQYMPTSGTSCLVEECYFNQCTTAIGETSIWRSEGGWSIPVEFRNSVIVTDNINCIQANNQGMGGTFYMHDVAVMKEVDDSGVQYTGGILYPGTTAAGGCTINTNPLLSRDASTSSGYKWDGSSYVSETV